MVSSFIYVQNVSEKQEFLSNFLMVFEVIKYFRHFFRFIWSWKKVICIIILFIFIRNIVFVFKSPKFRPRVYFLANIKFFHNLFDKCIVRSFGDNIIYFFWCDCFIVIIKLWRLVKMVGELIGRFCFFLNSKLVFWPFSALIKRKIFGGGGVSTRLLQTDNFIGNMWLRDGILMSFR